MSCVRNVYYAGGGPAHCRNTYQMLMCDIIQSLEKW